MHSPASDQHAPQPGSLAGSYPLARFCKHASERGRGEPERAEMPTAAMSHPWGPLVPVATAYTRPAGGHCLPAQATAQVVGLDCGASCPLRRSYFLEAGQARRNLPIRLPHVCPSFHRGGPHSLPGEALLDVSYVHATGCELRAHETFLSVSRWERACHQCLC